MWVRPPSAASHRVDSRSHLVLVHSIFLLNPSIYIPFLHLPPSTFHLPPPLAVMHIINPYDRYASDNSSSPDNALSRPRISFSRKAAPVVSITHTSAVSTGQENRTPTSCVPFPLSPQITSTETCRDAMYIPRPNDLFSTSERPEGVPLTQSRCRQRSNSGSMSIEQRSSRPLATLNSGSRAGVGSIDLGKSTPVLSITSSGTVSRADHGHLSETLAIARQRRLQQLDRKRNASMVTRRQTKKASVDSKFLITLHHSITWHIENRSDQKGPSSLHIRSRTSRDFDD